MNTECKLKPEINTNSPFQRCMLVKIPWTLCQPQTQAVCVELPLWDGADGV